MDTILLVGLVVLLASEGIFLAIGRIDRSTMPDRSRRLLNYTLLAGHCHPCHCHLPSVQRHLNGRQCLNLTHRSQEPNRVCRPREQSDIYRPDQAGITRSSAA